MRTRILIAAVVLPALALPIAAAAQEQRPPEHRTIAVSGRAEVFASPDLAILSVAVETVAPKAADAVSDNAARTAKVVAALKGLIGSDDRLTTTRYVLEPRYQQPKPGEVTEPRITGYVARNDVQVETHKTDKVGAMIDASTAAGANRVSSLEFTLSNRAEQLRAALTKAGAEAQAQAESVAKALGVTLKGVRSATTSSEPTVPPRRPYAEMSMMRAAAPTTVEPGSVSVSATLNVTYDIE